jgi:hypothetical protein
MFDVLRNSASGIFDNAGFHNLGFCDCCIVSHRTFPTVKVAGQDVPGCRLNLDGLVPGENRTTSFFFEKSSVVNHQALDVLDEVSNVVRQAALIPAATPPMTTNLAIKSPSPKKISSPADFLPKPDDKER